MFLALFSNQQIERDSKLAALTNKVDDLDSCSKSIEQKVENLEIQYKQTISTLEGKLLKAESKLDQLEQLQSKEVESLKTSIDLNGQYERRDTLIISGPDLPVASDNENSKLIIQDTLRRNLNLNLNPADISTAHRIGRKPAGGPDKRNIIFKLCRRDLARDIVDACKHKKPKFFINCSLTPTRNKIFYALRQLKRKFPSMVRGCNSNLNGDVTVFLASESSNPHGSSSSSARRGDRRMIINTRQELEKFAADYLHTSTDDLSINW